MNEVSNDVSPGEHHEPRALWRQRRTLQPWIFNQSNRQVWNHFKDAELPQDKEKFGEDR
jgi:hypothetical protein